MIRKGTETEAERFPSCHGGAGEVLCHSMLKQGESQFGICFFHHDTLAPGVSIGEHLHSGSEEIYYLLSGSCTLLFDGGASEMHAGDFSIVGVGHTHGIVNSSNDTAELIVVGVVDR